MTTLSAEKHPTFLVEGVEYSNEGRIQSKKLVMSLQGVLVNR